VLHAERSVAWFRIAVAATLGLLITAPASAQTNTGGLASISASGMALERDISASITASIGYRLNPIVAVGMELTLVPSYSPDVPDFPMILYGGSTLYGGTTLYGGATGAIFPPPSVAIEAAGGRATFFTGNVRLTIPTRSIRFTPYLVGGGGVGNVTDEFRYTYRAFPPFLVLDACRVCGPGFAPTFTESIRRTTTAFAMTLGGGVGVRLSDQWSVDVEARYLGVAGQRNINTGRYGAGMSFRF
jgi:opacity protein-like surface antigen